MIERDVRAYFIVSNYNQLSSNYYDRSEDFAGMRYSKNELGYSIIVLDKGTVLMNVAGHKDSDNMISIFFEVEALLQRRWRPI
jgi:hypothetical protein